MSNAVATTGILVKRRVGTATISSSSVANPSIITTTAPHGFQTGDNVVIAGHSGSTPAVSGLYVATRVDSTHFSIPVNVTVGGTGGTATAATTITSSSVANPSVITTPSAHNLVTGDIVTISGHSGSTPSINATYTITKISGTTFSIPVNVTVGGTGGQFVAHVTVAEITKVTPPGFSRNKIETSTHNDGTESYILGILRQKDAALMINYIASEATHAAVLSDVLSNTKNDWKILFPSGVQFDGPARVQTFQIADAPVDGAQQADLTLTWAGPVTQS